MHHADYKIWYFFKYLLWNTIFVWSMLWQYRQEAVRFELYFCLVERTNWFLCYLTGSCPKVMFDDQLHMVILALIECSKITQSTSKWAESRRDALKALISICHTVCSETVLGPGNFEFLQLWLYFWLSRLVVETGHIVILSRFHGSDYRRGLDWQLDLLDYKSVTHLQPSLLQLQLSHNSFWVSPGPRTSCRPNWLSLAIN
jgi:hypothetical protein